MPLGTLAIFVPWTPNFWGQQLPSGSNDVLSKRSWKEVRPSWPLLLAGLNHTKPPQSTSRDRNKRSEPFSIFLLISVWLLSPSAKKQTAVPGSCPNSWTKTWFFIIHLQKSASPETKHCYLWKNHEKSLRGQVSQKACCLVSLRRYFPRPWLGHGAFPIPGWSISWRSRMHLKNIGVLGVPCSNTSILLRTKLAMKFHQPLNWPFKSLSTLICRPQSVHHWRCGRWQSALDTSLGWLHKLLSQLSQSAWGAKSQASLGRMVVPAAEPAAWGFGRFWCS